MAIYQRREGGQSSGQNAMWQNLNAALAGYEQQGFIRRKDALRKELKGQGLLGFSGEGADVFNADGHINVGDKTGLTTNQHYDKLLKTHGEKKIRRALGANASKDDIKAFIQESVNERNAKVVNSIKMRMHELGSVETDDAGGVSYGNIYKVIPKLNEQGGKEFYDYYKTLDEGSKMELMNLGYNPGITAQWYLPEFAERDFAQGQHIRGVGKTALLPLVLAGAGIGGYKIAKAAGLVGKAAKGAKGAADLTKGATAGTHLTADQIKRLPARTQKLLNAYNSKGSIARAMEAGEISAQEAKILAQQLGGKGQQAVRTATAATGSANPLLIGGKVQKPPVPAWKRIGKGYLPFAVGAGAGGMIGQAVGGDTGEAVGGIGGMVSVPMFVKAYKNPAKRKAINAVLKKFAPKILTKLGVSALGYAGPQAAEPISTALGALGTAWAGYDAIKLAQELPELYDAITK